MNYRSFLLVTGLVLPATVAQLALLGCSGGVEVTPPSGGGGPSFRDAGRDGQAFGGHDGGYDDAGHDALPDYVDPGCPEAGPTPTQYACDPFQHQNGDCPKGKACFIYVVYPTTVCGKETYGSSCEANGYRVQGDPCTTPTECAAGYTCAVSGSGTQCVALCEVAGTTGCPAGLVCEPLDIEGFGGCL